MSSSEQLYIEISSQLEQFHTQLHRQRLLPIGSGFATDAVARITKVQR